MCAMGKLLRDSNTATAADAIAWYDRGATLTPTLSAQPHQTLTLTATLALAVAALPEVAHPLPSP
jgi:hypothetical protein